ncbi:hypothetical protein DFR68_104410 [Nocardia mexicana]|uniref:Uncharacterized protein n=2 Tax=Nocardia mexicana TaxID=279262 RepID=A0A370H6C6_9NOCA|nr:hypothetical protein DFR68_104410 [Nocardia mexicana]
MSHRVATLLAAVRPPSAIGFLRQDVSLSRQSWDEIQMRSLAKRFGYDLRKTVVFGLRTDRPVYRLRGIVRFLEVDAVLVPSIDHFESDEVPAELVGIVDVITVSPEHTYARWATGELPELRRR